MSVKSHRTKTSNLSSILKNPVTYRSKLNTAAPSPKVSFALPHSEKVRSILESYTSKANIRNYENLVCLIRDCDLSDKELSSLLKEASECIPLLRQELRLFIEAIITVRWVNRSDEIVTEYQTFLVNLLSAHNYYSKIVVDSLVANFLPDPADQEWPDGIPSENDSKKCINIHRVLHVLLRVIPVCKDLLLKSIAAHFPYLKKSAHTHELYLHNLLCITDYQPDIRQDILHVIFTKLIALDVNAPRDQIEQYEYNQEEVFNMEEEEFDESRLKHPVAHTLDVCMDKMFNYFITECHDMSTGQLVWENTKNLYNDMISIFKEVILQTYNTHHVQFVMFSLCSFKTTITEAFLNYLWKSICSPSISSNQRQASVAYYSGLISRGNFVHITMLKGALQQMADWIHAYISNQDGLECVNSDVRVHSVFYAVCQGLFYVIAFRHHDLLSTKKSIVFLESLNLPKMVTCRLNPLKFCQPTITQNFAAVTRTYQLAYCYSIMEHNARNVIPTVYKDEKGSAVVSNALIDTFFPFDPYLLKRSSQKIEPFYLNYLEFSEDDKKSESGEKDVEMDDFLGEQSPESYSVSKHERFSYGSSPGFKCKN